MMHRIVNTRCFWYICSSPFTENSLWQFKLRVIFFDFLSWFLADNLSKELLMLDVSRFFSLQKTCVILKNIYQRKKCSNSTVYHCVVHWLWKCLIIHSLVLKVLDDNTLNCFNACTKPRGYVEAIALGCWKWFPVIPRHYGVIGVESVWKRLKNRVI